MSISHRFRQVCYRIVQSLTHSIVVHPDVSSQPQDLLLGTLQQTYYLISTAVTQHLQHMTDELI